MRLHHLCMILCLGLGAVGTLPAEPEPPAMRLKYGDDARWAAPDWDDSDWSAIKYSEFPARRGIFWIRFRTSTPSTDTSGVPDRYVFTWSDGTSGVPVDAIFLSTVYSFELFFDGQKLAQGGVVGASRLAEVPGKLDHLVQIPEALRGGRDHVLALRMSTYHYNFPTSQFSAGFQAVNFAQRLRQEALQPVFPLVGAFGSLLMAATGMVLFWSVERRRSLWLVSVLSLLLALFYALIAARWLWPYRYDWHYPRLLAITWVLTGASVLLVWLLAELFDAPRKAWWVALLALFLAAAWQASEIYELIALWICRGMFVVALLITGWATWRRRPGAWLALAGVAAALLVVRTERRAFLDPTFFLAIEGLVLLAFATLGAQVQAERRRAREATLTAARLESELLKKNLQPHFLLNTLTAVSEVIEQDPGGAVKFIDDLAAEFRTLALMSGERLVPLKRERELCEAHLKVIGRRTGRPISLEVDGGDDTALVPPAVFLTLIENGLVHQRPESGAAFRLVVQPAVGGVKYVFLSPGRVRDLAGRPEGGTGLRYVKARLEESFPGKWTLTQGAVAEGWQTVIGWRWQAKQEGPI